MSVEPAETSSTEELAATQATVAELQAEIDRSHERRIELRQLLADCTLERDALRELRIAEAPRKARLYTALGVAVCVTIAAILTSVAALLGQTHRPRAEIRGEVLRTEPGRGVQIRLFCDE